MAADPVVDHVSGDADDIEPFLVRCVDLQALPDRVLVRPVALGHRLADDDDQRLENITLDHRMAAQTVIQLALDWTSSMSDWNPAAGQDREDGSNNPSTR